MSVLVKNPMIVAGGEAKFSHYSGGTYLAANGNDYYYLLNYSNTSIDYLHSDTQEIIDQAFYKYEFSKSSSWDFTVINIPYSIKKIGESAFKYSNITSLSFANAGTQLSYNAFYGCNNLTSVSLPSSLETIPMGCFAYCDITGSFSTNATRIDSDSFVGNRHLTSIYLPYVTYLGNNAFSNCEALTTVSQPFPVEYMGCNVFTGCNNLSTIYLPDTLTSCYDNPIGHCSGLTKISVDSNNNTFYSINDKLIMTTDNETGLRKVIAILNLDDLPNDGTVQILGNGCMIQTDNNHSTWSNPYVLPEGIVKLESFALTWGYDSHSDYCILLPNSLEDGGRYMAANTSGMHIKWSDPFNCNYTTVIQNAFSQTNSNCTIELPATVTSIEGWAFSNSSSGFTELNYAGTVNDWQNISKDSDWNADCYLTTVHCSDGDINL